MKYLFSDGASLTISRFLAGFVHLSDEIEFDPTAVDPNRELRVVQNTSHRPRELYCAPIGYVTQPKPDKRDEYFVRAAVTGSRLGVTHVHLSNAAVRDYFYFNNRRCPGCEEQTLYDLLRTVPSAGPVDLRLTLKVRLLELQTDAASKDQSRAVERAFNLLARPDLRSCYQALLRDPDAPALSPYPWCPPQSTRSGPDTRGFEAWPGRCLRRYCEIHAWSDCHAALDRFPGTGRG